MARFKIHPIKRFARFISQPTLATTQLFVITILAWNVLRFYPGDRWLAVRLGNYFAPWLFMGLVPALIVALLGRRRWLGVATLVALLLFAGRYSYLFIPRPQPVSAETNVDQLKVMTFNVHYSNRNAEDIANLIRAEKPDIIALQEVTEELADSLLPELASDYPHSLYDNLWGFPLVLLSRYPLQAQPRLPKVQRSIQAIVETPHGDITIWNVHNFVTIDQIGWDSQKQTLNVIAQEIEAKNNPAIILGDFNTTDYAENYFLITNHLIDVHQAIGRGFGFTYPETDVLNKIPSAPWFIQIMRLAQPIFRIDHIFVSHHFVPQETHVIPHGFGSDHRPVVATLQIASK